MSIDFHESAPEFESEIKIEPRELDISIKRSEDPNTWIFSFKTDDSLERQAYASAIETSVKFEDFHAERLSNKEDLEQIWEISRVPDDVEPVDFQKFLSDIQSRANSNLRTPLAA